MHRFIISATLLGLVACDLPSKLIDITGDWKLELTDAEACLIELEVEQDGDKLEGDALVECRVYFWIGDEQYYYDLEEDRVELDGEIDLDDGEFEIDLEFYDDYFEMNIEIVLEGEVDGDEMDGDVEILGDDWGSFKGELD